MRALGTALGLCALLTTVVGQQQAAPRTEALRAPGLRSELEIVRDDFGVAHVFASNDHDVFFGYGYAVAQDRMFQMDMIRRSVAGRLSEVLGARPMGGRNASGRARQTTVDHDRFVRIWGLYDHAERIYPGLSAPTRTACEGFAAGVNFYLQTHPGDLLYLFEKLGYQPEPWTPVDSVACWYQIAIKLGGKWRNTALRPPRPAGRPRPVPVRYVGLVDPGSDCMVTEGEMRTDAAAYQELMRIADRAAEKEKEGRDDPLLEQTLASLGSTEAWRPKMSHAWAVGGARSSTGHAMLESDPQLAVSLPPVIYEIHLCGGSYDIRGISIPGAPGFLIGRNAHLAWGVTAAGGHDSNIYLETIDPEDRDRYRHEGAWHRARIRHETIAVKDGDPVVLRIRHTLHGPILDDLLPPAAAARRTLSVAHVATVARTAPVQGLLAMGRARNWDEFRAALRDYHLPAGHFIVADTEGRIGYHLGTTTPYMPFGVSNDVLDGASGSFDWQYFEPPDGEGAHDHRGPFVPHRILPHAFDLARGWIASANNTSVGPWYPVDIGFRGRDSDRSIRLRELLAAREKVSVTDMQRIHADVESPMPRTMIRGALAIMAEEPPDSELLRHAQRILSGWDGKMTLEPTTWPLVSTIAQRLVRFANARARPELAEFYGPGPIGAGNMAKLFTPGLARGEAPDDPLARAAMLELVELAMEEVAERYGTDETRWRLPRRANLHGMEYQAGLLNLGSLDRTRNRSEAFDCLYVPTIRSPSGNCYSLLVEMGDPDNMWTILPPGISEHPESPHFADQVADWREARLHRAYMSRAAVDKVATGRVKFAPRRE